MLEGTVLEVGIGFASVERTVDVGGIPRSLTPDGQILWIGRPGSHHIAGAGRRSPTVPGVHVRERARR